MSDDGPVLRPARPDELDLVAALHVETTAAAAADLARRGSAAFRFYRDKVRAFAAVEPAGVLIAEDPEDPGSEVPAGFLITTSDAADFRRRLLASGRAISGGLKGLLGWYGPGKIAKVLRLPHTLFLARVRRTGGGAAPPDVGLPRAKIWAVVVREECRRRGIGRALVEAACRHARDHGADAMAITVERDNAAAHRLYQDAGFDEHGLVAESTGPSRLLIRPLAPSSAALHEGVGAHARRGARRGDRRTAVVLGLVMLLLYGFTAAPSVTWGDSAKLVNMTLDLPGSLQARATEHGLRNVLAWPFLWLNPGEPAWGQAIASGVFGSLALVILFGSLRALGVGRTGALMGAGALGVSHLFWHMSTVAEHWTLTVLTLVVLLRLWVAWRDMGEDGLLGWMGLVAGLGAWNSLLVVLLAPALLVGLGAARLHRRGAGPALRAVRPAVIGFALGLVPLAVLFLLALRHRDLAEQWELFTEGRYRAQLTANPGRAVRMLVVEAGLLVYQYPVAWILAAIGAVAAWRRRREHRATWLLLWTAGAIAAVFAALYLSFLPQRGVWLVLPVSLVTAVWIGVGADACMRRWSGRRGPAEALLTAAVLAAPVVYLVTPAAVDRAEQRMERSLVPGRDLPYRDEAAFFLQPWKRGADGAMRYARDAHAQVTDLRTDRGAPERITIVADFTPKAVLEYAMDVHGLLPGVELVSIGDADRAGTWALHGPDHWVFAADDHPAYDLESVPGPVGAPDPLVPIGPLPAGDR